MAIKHKLARLACAWDGHRPVHGYRLICGDTYDLRQQPVACPKCDDRWIEP